MKDNNSNSEIEARIIEGAKEDYKNLRKKTSNLLELIKLDMSYIKSIQVIKKSFKKLEKEGLDISEEPVNPFDSPEIRESIEEGNKIINMLNQSQKEVDEILNDADIKAKKDKENN